MERERGKEIKRELFTEGPLLYLCILLRFGNILKLMPMGAPSLEECSHTGTSLTKFTT
jgi:hypothetical protein